MKLKKYLRLIDRTAEWFGQKYGMEGNIIRRIIKGESPSLKTAMLIEHATEGKVTCKDLISPKHLAQIKSLLEAVSQKQLIEEDENGHDDASQKSIDNTP